jgi:phage baseplate assembly protein W
VADMIDVPHLRVPLRVLPTGNAATVEQDTDTEIEQNIRVLLATRPGERLADAEFGVPDPLFTGPDEAAISEALERFEPRARVELTVDYDTDDPGRVDVTVALSDRD